MRGEVASDRRLFGEDGGETHAVPFVPPAPDRRPCGCDNRRPRTRARRRSAEAHRVHRLRVRDELREIHLARVSLHTLDAATMSSMRTRQSLSRTDRLCENASAELALDGVLHDQVDRSAENALKLALHAKELEQPDGTIE